VLVALGDLVVSVVGLVVDNWGTIGPVVQAVQNYIAAALKVVGDVIRLFAAILRGDWSAAWSAVLAIIRDVWGLIVAYVKMVLAELKAILQAAWAVIKAAASAVWNGILAVVSGVWDLIRSVVYQGASALGSTLSGAWSSIKSGVSSAWNAVKSTISGAVDGIGNTVDRIADKIGGVVGAVRSAAGRVASAILSPINSVIRAWNGLAFSVPKVSFPGVSIMGRQIVPGFGFGPYRFDFPNLPELARGGVVNAPTLALLGEGSGREIVAPEALLREIIADGGGGGSYTLNVYARRADAQDVAYGFRRLELLRTGR
jgi:phage-related protein